MAKKLLALLLCALMLLSIVACGGGGEKNDDTGNNDVTDSGETTNDEIADFLQTYNPEDTAESYVEPVEETHDFGGHEFKFLNSAPI